MNTPDSRPIGVLTPAILATASHWCIRWGGNALTVPARQITVFSASIDAYGLTFGSGSESETTCYPCTLQPNGLIVPEPWPVLDGEEEIEKWRGMSLDANIFHEPWSPMWCCYVAGKLGKPLVARPNMHPAPRRGGKWVWENDR